MVTGIVKVHSNDTKRYDVRTEVTHLVEDW
jgi:hypothetical protein